MKFSIDFIFRVVVILLLLMQQAGIQYFYNKADKFEKEATQTKEFYKEKEIIRETNAAGQMKAKVEVDELSIKLFSELMDKKLQLLSKQFNSELNKNSARIHSMTDLSITTRLESLKMAKIDTTINVITIVGDTTQRQGKVGHYDDTYNKFSIMDNGETYEVLPGSTIRNDVTTTVYQGARPKLIWIIPKFWKPKPFVSETYLYNPLSGVDTVRTVVVSERVNKKKPN